MWFGFYFCPYFRCHSQTVSTSVPVKDSGTSALACVRLWKQVVHYLCHCLCQSKIYTNKGWMTCHCRSDSSLCALCDRQLNSINDVQYHTWPFFPLLSHRKTWEIKKGVSVWIFIVFKSKCTKSMQKIASLYILVHIYIATTAFHRGVPCFCFLYGRQGSEYIQRHARDDTRQKHKGSRHLQNTHIGTDVTLSSLTWQYAQAHSLSPPPFGYNNDLKSWGISRCCSLPVLQPWHL